MTVRQLLQSLDSAEITEWIAFLELEAGRTQQPASEVDEDELWRKAFNCG